MYQELRNSRCCSTGTLSIHIQEMDGRKLVRPTIASSWNGKRMTIASDFAWIADVENHGKTIIVRCQDPQVSLGSIEFTHQGVQEFHLPIREY